MRARGIIHRVSTIKRGAFRVIFIIMMKTVKIFRKRKFIYRSSPQILCTTKCVAAVTIPAVDIAVPVVVYPVVAHFVRRAAARQGNREASSGPGTIGGGLDRIGSRGKMRFDA
jgi:hypothetical protein